MRNAPSNSDDVIDSRDIIARIEELEGEREALVSDVDDTGEELQRVREVSPDDAKLVGLQGDYDDAEKALHDWDEDYGAELKALQALAEEGEGYASDWRHGETLIRDSYFEDYARQLAEDIGTIPNDVQWPCTCIDWKQAAEELQQDYTQVDFDGVAYWIR